MPDFRLPFSGNVTQAINPWQWMLSAVGSQFGLVNINLGKSADPAVEQRILEDVGTYGRQIGRLGDALRVLIDRLPPDAREEPAIKAVLRQLDDVEEIKHRRHRPA